MRCIFIYANETTYEVSTYWGWFRLDEGAYRDYLAGKLWINWIPNSAKACNENTQIIQHEQLPDVSREAIALRDCAAKYGVFNTMSKNFPGKEAVLPYRRRMNDLPIEELNLSVRSFNGLKRANAHTFGKLKDIMESERGLRGIRNLGAKSEDEIWHCFFSSCYSLLSQGEKALFWQDLIGKYD